MLNERFINEIIDNEGERQKEMADRDTCQHCGRTSGGVSRSCLLIGEGSSDVGGKVDASAI